MFLHSFHPAPVLVDFGFVALRWYGLLLSLSMLLGLWLGQKLFLRYRLSPRLFFDLAFYTIIFGLLGARLWHVFSELPYYLRFPWAIFQFWQGGLAIHGAIVAGAFFIYYYYRKHRAALPGLDFPLLLDIFSPLIALGQALGRWGNYFNSELYGRPTTSIFGLPIDPLNRLAGYENFQYYHPIFLYESLWCFLLFGLLFFLNYKNAASQIKKSGSIFSLYLILYSLERFLIGFLRIDPQLFFGGLRLDQWVSAILFLTGIYFLYQRAKKHHASQPPKIS